MDWKRKWQANILCVIRPVGFAREIKSNMALALHNENINIQEASESEESSEDKSEDDALVNEECQKNTNKETPGKFTTMMNYEIPLVGMSARSAAR